MHFRTYTHTNRILHYILIKSGMFLSISVLSHAYLFSFIVNVNLIDATLYDWSENRTACF